MTVSVRRPFERRVSLLSSSMLSSAALAILAGVGAAMAPDAAEAAACTQIGTALYCNGPEGGNSATGLSLVDLGAPAPHGTGAASVATGTQNFTTTGTGFGLTFIVENNGSSIGTLAGDALDVTTDHAAVVTVGGLVSGGGDNGVNVQTTTGNGSILANINSSVTGGLTAVNAAAAGAADVTVNVSGDNTVLQGGLAGGFGVSATSVGGNVVVSASAAPGSPASITGGTGIFASTSGGGSGNVTVLSNDNVTATRGPAIEASSDGSGFVTVGYNLTTSTAQPITGTAVATSIGDGIDARNTGSGSVIVETGAATISGRGGNRVGINAVASGATANVTVNALDTNINGVDQGINAATAGSGTVTVESSISAGIHATPTGVIASTNGDGIFALDASGTVNIGLALNPILTGITAGTGITGGDGNGIFARTTAGGAINAYTGTGLLTGMDGNGLWLDGEAGGDITLTANGTAFSGTESGVAASTFGAGAVNLLGTNIAAQAGDGSGVGAVSENGVINIGTSTNRLTTGFGIGADIDSTMGVGVGAQALGSGDINIYTGAGHFSSEGNVTGAAALVALGQHNGNITVDMSAGAFSGNYDGVDAESAGTGTINVKANGSIITGAGNIGIDALSLGATGDVTVNLTDTPVSGVVNGINATAAGSGTVTVLDTVSPGVHLVGTTGIVNASHGDAIFAISGTGTVNIGTALNPIITENDIVNGITGTGGNGIVGQTTNGGAINLYTDGGLVTGASGAGALLHGGADAVLLANLTNTNFTGSNSGLDLETSGAGTITVFSTGGAIQGTNGSGISANSTNGNVTVGTSADRITTGFGAFTSIGSTHNDGIASEAIGTGSASIYTGAGLFFSQSNTVGSAALVGLSVHGGAVIVDMSGSVVEGNSTGVAASTTGAGDITVNALDAFISGSGAGGFGVNAENIGTAASVSFSGTDTVVKGVNAGLFFKTTGAGTVTILDTITPGVHLVGTAGVIQASNGDAIYGSSGTGTVNIGTALNPIITANDSVNGITGTGGNGIAATTITGGAINLYTGGGLITGTGGEGAFLDGGPGANVTVGALNTSFTGSDSGLLIDTAGAGTVTINSTGGSITGVGGTGIVAQGQDGDVSVGSSATRITTGTTVATDISGGGGDGIGAATTGAGNVNIYTGTGLIFSNAGVPNSAAIVGLAAGAGNVTIDLAGTDAGGYDGVAAIGNTGTVKVNLTNGVIAGMQDGIDASGAGPITVTIGAGGVVGGVAGHAINTVAGTDFAQIDLSGASGAATTIEAPGTSTASAVIDVTQASGGLTTVDNGTFSTVRSFTGHFTDLAIHASGAHGSVRIANSGVLDGDIDLSGLTDAGASLALSSNTLLDNTASGVWHTAGTDRFGSGGALAVGALSNAGYIGTSGATTTLAFGAATTNTVTNTGTLMVGEATTASPLPYASSLVITHLGAFNNSGVIDLSDGAATPDRILTAAGASFTGSGASQIRLDAQLGGAGSTADTLAFATTTGSTHILVSDATPAANGAYTGPAGITLVTTSGANGANAFTLDPGSSDYHLLSGQGALIKGLFFYGLVNNPNTTVLLSALDPQAYEFSYLTSGAQQIWYASAPWQDRQADLRDSLNLNGAATGGFEPGLWMKALGDWSNRDLSVSPMPGFVFDTSYRQTTGGVVGGYDAVKRDMGGKGNEGLFGVSLGYLDSGLDFRADNTQDTYQGWTAGLYATWLDHAFFIDGDLKADVLRLHVDAPGLFTGAANANSIGGQAETGLRLAAGGLTVEPVGSLAYVQTRIGDFNVAGTTVRTGDNDSFRGSLGLRLSGDLVSNDHVLLKLAGEARVWDEFASGNTTSFLSSGPTLEVNDKIKGTYGETGVSLNLFSRDGRSSAFFNTSVKFKSGYTDDKIALGYRYQWGAMAAH